jgi:hypothetical protein
MKGNVSMALFLNAMGAQFPDDSLPHSVQLIPLSGYQFQEDLAR